MPVVYVVRAFPYSADGLSSLMAEAGMHLDVRAALVPGLIAAGLVRRAEHVPHRITAEPEAALPALSEPVSEPLAGMSEATAGLFVAPPEAPRSKPRRFGPRGS